MVPWRGLRRERGVAGAAQDVPRGATRHGTVDRVHPQVLRGVCGATSGSEASCQARTSLTEESLLFGEDDAELLQSFGLEARDVHLRDVEAFCDLRLRNRLVEAEIDNHSLAAGERVKRALEIGAIFEQP